MRQKKLMIVTTAYPYGKGESFLQAELEQISAHFGRVELVPCTRPEGRQRSDREDVNLGYVNMRWNAMRQFHVAMAFVAALFKYDWMGDLRRIMRGPHKLDNATELARALYRARMFETFLSERLRGGKQALDVIYFYWMVPEILGAIRFRDRFAPDIKVVSRAHRGDLYTELRSGDYIGMRESIVGGIDEIYCISEHGRDYMLDKYDCPAGKVHLARLGVNDPGFLGEVPADTALSIVSCAFAVEEKRLHLLVDAIRFLTDTQPGLTIKWIHVGDGPLYDRLRADAASKLGGRAEVVFKGYQTQDQVIELYRRERFDVFVNVSVSEGIPVSLMEASSVGIPMVATDVGGNCEIVNHENGMLLPADPDVPMIAEALLSFRDRGRALSCRKNARAQWERRFNAAVNHAAFGRQLANSGAPVLEPRLRAVASN